LVSWRFIKVFDHQQLYPHQTINEQPLIALLRQQLLPQLTNHSEITVFHWLDPDCKCTLIGRFFVEQLTKQNFSGQVLHVVLTPPGLASGLSDAFVLPKEVIVMALTAEQYQQSRQLIPATPGATIYYAKNQSLSYLGPHSSGVTCGTGTNYIELVLNNLTHGFDPKLIELRQRGCFCSW
jgi:hypothetical protein